MIREDNNGSSAPPGGLVPIMSALVEELGGRWIFTAPAGFPSGSGPETLPVGAKSSWQPLPIAQSLMNRQRRSMSVGILLWLFHYLHDTATAPSFDADVLPAWEAYREINQRYADALAASHENLSDEVVLINDFHMMLVPSMFSARVPDRASRLAYFHHVPWCEPDYFGILPVWMRTQILESLLTCDVVGFHCKRWGDGFLACCDRYLPSAAIADRAAVYRGHETLVTTAPGPIDAMKIDQLRAEPATQQWREALRRRAAGRRIITRVDRLDLWKNVVRGFSAYETLLRRNPRLAADCWFCAIVSPPRFPTERHRRYQAACEDAARKINESCAGDREAVSLIFPEGADDQRHRAIAALEVGSSTLVNPTYDGLNMVAKESLLVNPRAHLLLSTNAGVYPQLASVVAPIHPFDVMATADALERAMEDQGLPSDHEVDACIASLRDEKATTWLQAVLHGPGPGDP